MNNKRKFFILIFAVIAGVLIIFSAYEIMRTRYYRSQLPELPDFSSINTSMQEQITDANKNAYNHPNSDNLGSLGMVYNSNTFYDKASQCYKLALKRNPKNWIWSYYLGYMNMELNESKTAIEYFSDVIKRNPKAYQAVYYTGEMYQYLNKIDTAERLLLEIASLDNTIFLIKNTSRTSYFPLPVYAKFQISRNYLKANRLDFAEKQLKEIIQDQITFGPAYRQLGNLYAIRGDSTLSRYYSSRANDFTIYSAPVDTLVDKLAMISRSDIFLMKQIDLAIRSVNSQWANDLLINGLKYFPENKYLISKAITQFFNTGLYDYALPYIDLHIKYFSDDFDELREVGSLVADAGYKPQASKYFLKAESLKNEKAENRSLLALLLYEKVQMKENAAILMTEVLEKNPDDLIILRNGIYLFLEMYEKVKALKYLNMFKHLSPQNPDIMIFTGLITEQEGNLKGAIVLFEKANKIKPKDRSLTKHLGDIYLREKMWSKAIDFFRKAIELYPNDSYFQVNLGGLLVSCPDIKLRNLTEGKEYSERAFYNFRYNFSTRISAGRTLAIAYDELGDGEKAYYYINRTLNLARNVPTSKDYLKNLEDLSRQYSSKK